jgi:hypothetical protein
MYLKVLSERDYIRKIVLKNKASKDTLHEIEMLLQLRTDLDYV